MRRITFALLLLLAAATFAEWDYVAIEPMERWNIRDIETFTGKSVNGNARGQFYPQGIYFTRFHPNNEAPGVYRVAMPHECKESNAFKDLFPRPENTLVFVNWLNEREGVYWYNDADSSVIGPGNWNTNGFCSPAMCVSHADMSTLFENMASLTNKYIVGGGIVGGGMELKRAPDFPEMAKMMGIDISPVKIMAPENPFAQGKIMRYNHLAILEQLASAFDDAEPWLSLRWSPFCVKWKWRTTKREHKAGPSLDYTTNSSGPEYGGEKHCTVTPVYPETEDLSEDIEFDSGMGMLSFTRSEEVTKYRTAMGAWISPVYEYEDGEAKYKSPGKFMGYGGIMSWSTGLISSQVPSDQIFNYVNSTVCGGRIDQAYGILCARVISNMSIDARGWRVDMKGVEPTHVIETNYYVKSMPFTVGGNTCRFGGNIDDFLSDAIEVCCDKKLMEYAGSYTAFGDWNSVEREWETTNPPWGRAAYNFNFKRQATMNGSFYAEIISCNLFAKPKFKYTPPSP